MRLPEFLSPERLWALWLLPVLVVAYLLALRAGARKGVRYPNTGVLARVLGRQSRWVRHLAVAMSLCSLGALALAWAQPMGVESVPRERATIVLVLDVSHSMAATDVEPNRFDAARGAVGEFLRTAPAMYNISIVSLSASPSIKLPPSTDRGAAQRAVDALALSDGTAIGDALTEAAKSVKLAPEGDGEDQAPAGIVLLSDGANTEGGDPLEAARAVRDAKVPVYTIAFGTENGFVDLDGKRYAVAPDRQLLAQIAETTGGRALTATSAEELKSVYSEVGSSLGHEQVRKPVTAQYAFGALGFAIVAALGAVMMAARWP